MALTLATPLNEIELVPGSAIRLNRVSWDSYLLLLQELGENRSTRVSFQGGVLEIRMPGLLHEVINRLLATIIMTLAEVFDKEFNNAGSTRFNRADLEQGIEPDSCFYIQHAIAGQGISPSAASLSVGSSDWMPPDLAIEVDIANSSENKLSIYQTLAVPELWLYKEGKLHIKGLQRQRYSDVARSIAFPSITSTQLNEWIKLREQGTDLTVIKAIRSQVKFKPSQSL